MVDRAKYFFLDYLGVAVRGSLSDSSQPLYRLASSLAPTGQGTVLGRAEKANFPYAALANGTSAHSLELDDTHQGRVDSSGRVGLFRGARRGGTGWCERQGFSHRPAWSALRSRPRLAMALKPTEHYGRGFHPTATCGTFGAAASAAKLAGVE